MEVAHKDGAFKVNEFVCYADRAKEKARQRAEDKAKRENNGKLPDGWGTGRHWVVTPVDIPERGGSDGH